mmetsp:Transcript_30921/g.103013  ORF Transcript_30921/g.103013 Transcript_30921/m.103013 type:complete len:236 (+) Transcript_30921:11192-11899(+)
MAARALRPDHVQRPHRARELDAARHGADQGEPAAADTGRAPLGAVPLRAPLPLEVRGEAAWHLLLAPPPGGAAPLRCALGERLARRPRHRLREVHRRGLGAEVESLLGRRRHEGVQGGEGCAGGDDDVNGHQLLGQVRNEVQEPHRGAAEERHRWLADGPLPGAWPPRRARGRPKAALEDEAQRLARLDDGPARQREGADVAPCLRGRRLRRHRRARRPAGIPEALHRVPGQKHG